MIKSICGLLDGYEADKSQGTISPSRARRCSVISSPTPLEFRYLEQYLNSPYGVAFRRDKILGSEGDGDLYRSAF